MSSFSLRIPDDLMAEAKRLAVENHTSLNQFFLATIAEKIGEAKAKQHFKNRAQFGPSSSRKPATHCFAASIVGESFRDARFSGNARRKAAEM